MNQSLKKTLAFLAAIGTVVVSAVVFWLISTGFGAGVELYSTADSGAKVILGLVIITAVVVYVLYRTFLLFGRELDSATEEA
jgi:thiamine transporter ThiT